MEIFNVKDNYTTDRRHSLNTNFERVSALHWPEWPENPTHSTVDRMGCIFGETTPRAWHFGVEDFHHFWEKHVKNADSSRAVRRLLNIRMDIKKAAFTCSALTVMKIIVVVW